MFIQKYLLYELELNIQQGKLTIVSSSLCEYSNMIANLVKLLFQLFCVPEVSCYGKMEEPEDTFTGTEEGKIAYNRHKQFQLGQR